MPQELANAQGQVIWQASYKTWGSTVAEEWEVKTLAGSPIHKLDEGDSPAKADQQQNLRFQGQYLDRDTGLHYNTFRYYDPDVGRFICPDPIGLAGGINLGSYSPNPLMWIDPWGWNKNSNDTVGDWVLYDVDDPHGGKAKVGIGQEERKMADGTNARANASARRVRRDPNFPNARPTEVSKHPGITKKEMKEIEAKRVRDLRRQGEALPHNRENDKKYRPDYDDDSGKKGCK